MKTQSMMNARMGICLQFLLLLDFALIACAAEVSTNGPGRSLTHPTSAEAAPGRDGFIQRWLILEPIRVNTQLTDTAINSAVKKEYFPNQLSLIPRDGDKVKVDGADLTWHTVETKEYNVNLYHFAHEHNAPSSDVMFWALTIVHCPEEMRGVRLAIGSNAASVWWINDKEVIGIYGDRQTVIDDGVSKRLTLKKGANVVRCAIFNGGGATDFCARFLDMNEKPLMTFSVTLNGPGL
jgi:hypothetical protein